MQKLNLNPQGEYFGVGDAGWKPFDRTVSGRYVGVMAWLDDTQKSGAIR